jgi:hypothetical protein
LSTEENDILTVEFIEDEVKEAIMQMDWNKAPGSDGLSVEFYQRFWEVIKENLMAMFAQLRT